MFYFLVSLLLVRNEKSSLDKYNSENGICFRRDHSDGIYVVDLRKCDDNKYNYQKSTYNIPDKAKGLLSIKVRVTTIDTEAFADCVNVVSVRLPKSLKEICSRAFSGCTGLTTLIWDSEESVVINRHAFFNCVNLVITTPFKCSELSEYAFYNVNCFSIPSISTIPDFAFSYSKNIGVLEIPSTVTSIGTSVFQCCPYITEVVIPSSIVSIGPSCFSQCESLATISISAVSFSILPENCFYKCTKLIAFICPEGISTIRKSCFEGCTSLNILNLSESIQIIGESAFMNCSSLKGILTIPNSIVSISVNAFINCSLEGVEYFGSVEMPSNVVVFDPYLICLVESTYPGNFFYNIPIKRKYVKTPDITPFFTPMISPMITPFQTSISTPLNSPFNSPVITPIKSPYSTPNLTPFDTPYSTPFITPFDSPFSTPDLTPFSTPDLTPFDTPYSTPFITPFDSPFSTPDLTPFDSPFITPIRTQSMTILSTPLFTPSETIPPEHTPSHIEDQTQQITDTASIIIDETKLEDNENLLENDQSNGNASNELAKTIIIISITGSVVCFIIIIVIIVVAIKIFKRNKNESSSVLSSSSYYDDESDNLSYLNSNQIIPHTMTSIVANSTETFSNGDDIMTSSVHNSYENETEDLNDELSYE